MYTAFHCLPKSVNSRVNQLVDLHIIYTWLTIEVSHTIIAQQLQSYHCDIKNFERLWLH